MSNSAQHFIPITPKCGDRIAGVRTALVPDEFPVKELALRPINVLDLKDTERSQLLEGPRISVIADGNIVIRKGVPARALMASAAEVHTLLDIKPLTTQFHIHGKINSKCIQALLDIFTTESLIKATEINLSGGDFVTDVLLYQACLSLGILHHHTKPLLNALRSEITARLLTYAELNTVINRIPPTDPLFKHLAHALCHRRFRKEIPNIVAFEKWLGYKSTLQKMMVDIDQLHKKRREAIKAKQCSWRLNSEDQK